MPSYCFDSGDMVNKRTADLFAQALDEAVPETWTTLNPVQLMRLRDKFAELIVEECGDVAYNAYWDNPETVRGIHIKEKIKQHFGVK